jgi:N6-adenosine-specific RNA methylase IME4
MMPTANKIELFARNNNLRPGWFSLGNQLGEKYLKDAMTIYCKNCKL